MQSDYIIIDYNKVSNAIKKSRYKTIGNLAKKFNVHRNTISDYLRGKTPVILPVFCELLSALNLKAEDIFITNEKKISDIRQVGKIIDQLCITMPDVAFFLFGSRSRGTQKEFSDFDIGVYRKDGINGMDFSKLHMPVIEWNENNMTNVQISNLNNASMSFLNSIAQDLQFLAGSYVSRCEIEKLLNLID
ncbi:MAG TPA: nucleotidyltransferase domain-containing protein [Oligoflexia bacterium]|nr:nucleotidyltransferase domain-containing protein [Oligoflexia bacterium]HMP49901.1 nucleotidyltransferase domain-containing protein [Oligoflexia bacterium]